MDSSHGLLLLSDTELPNKNSTSYTQINFNSFFFVGEMNIPQILIFLTNLFYRNSCKEVTNSILAELYFNLGKKCHNENFSNL